MILTTISQLDGYKVRRFLGVASGIGLRTATISQSILGDLKNSLGGKNKSYAEMCGEAHLEAFHNMLLEAEKWGADAVIGIQYNSTNIGGSNIVSIQTLCYGTAVKLQLANSKKPNETNPDHS